MFSQCSSSRVSYPQGPLAPPTPRGERFEDVRYLGDNMRFLETGTCLNRPLLRHLDAPQGPSARLCRDTIHNRRGLTSGSRTTHKAALASEVSEFTKIWTGNPEDTLDAPLLRCRLSVSLHVGVVFGISSQVKAASTR